ncbi:MarC family protein [Lignipirellula cremea]|uniref:UPF0056 membrane protein n=1 Tax=Lignipirellula cremea TaxID=2528010 RepID=A0A518DXX0_9BACT|nr:MarC family protein [Lignipirellula cremea]QDU96693.1 putative antibiotic transporter [Lignipirellula cremea]
MEMPNDAFWDSLLLLLVLLNPFLLSVYLMDLIQELEGHVFRGAMVQGSLIATLVFIMFAFAGDAIFDDVLQVRFASFLIFGGIVFLVVAIRYVMVGSEAIRSLRGAPEHVAGSIALPFMIGPGTVSASVMAGSRLPFLWAALAIIAAMTFAVISVLLLKWLHDSVRERYENYVSRYVDVVGRVTALIIGTIAVEMILKGVELWIEKFQSA